MKSEMIIDGIKNVHFISKLQEHAKKTPDKIALQGMGESFTYKELDYITTAVAEEIIMRGARPNDIIGVIYERHVDVFFAAIGCWKARTEYFYLDVKTPEHTIKERIEDSNCIFMIDEEFISKCKDKVLNHNYCPDSLPVGDLDDAAWILYTSGSSGKSKGVHLKQRSIAVHMNIADVLGTTENDTQSMLASFSFMSGLLEGFPILYKGGTLKMIPQEYRRDLDKIVEFWEKENITVGFVPSHYTERIVHSDISLKTIRTLLTGGEPVHNLKKMPFNIFCFYGSSECGGPVTCCKIDYEAENYPIGPAIPMVKLYLLREGFLLPAEEGEAGEICVAGMQISEGYLNKPEFTEAKYFENPFTDDPNYKRLYRTGDLGTKDEEGNIFYKCRADLMCKIKSFRIEMGAVESEMINYPGIERCVVKPFTNKEGERELHGFYYSEADIDEVDFRKYLNERLIHYMVPAHLHRLAQIQVTDNGKVDRSAIKLEGYVE